MKKSAICVPQTRTMHRLCFVLALLGVVVARHPLDASSQEADKDAAASTSEEAIRRATAAYRGAVEDGDLDAVAKFWTPDADYVDHLGHAFKMQAALAAAKDRSQKDGRIARPPLKIETLAIRFISPDVAVEDGIVERAVVTGEQQAKGRYCAVWVRRDGKWLIDGIRESTYSAVTSSNHFEGLEWMVGEWVAEGPQATAEASYAWGPKKKFLLGQIKLTRKGEEPIAATQWIGWDPDRERIRSFEFDSEGGFHDGVWTRDGEAWVVSSSGIVRDGEHETATSIYSRIDDKTALWELVDDEIEGNPRTDIQLRATRKQRSK